MSSSIADGLLNAAREYLGYKEEAGGYTRFGDWYYATIDKSDPYFKTAPWCDMFITWAAHRAGVEDHVGDFAATVDHARWFKKQHAWSDKPEPGAIVFFDWGGSRNIKAIDHVGIVEKVDGAKIVTIEANVDKVWLKRKERDQTKVVGYGLPRKVIPAPDAEVSALPVRVAQPSHLPEVQPLALVVLLAGLAGAAGIGLRHVWGSRRARSGAHRADQAPAPVVVDVDDLHDVAGLR